MSDQRQWPPLAIPNFSAARDQTTIEAIAESLSASNTTARLLDIHSDADHNRSVFTLTGPSPELVDALVNGAATAIDKIDLNNHEGRHPRVGSLDVAPFVHMDSAGRGAACAAALTLADRLGRELKLPVFLYGELTQSKRTRADLRRGGPTELKRRIDAHELKPDFGPEQLHPSAGAVLVASRAPLVAFNVVLVPDPRNDIIFAQQISAAIRENGNQGLPGVRAIAVALSSQGDAVQVSTNIEDYRRTSPAEVLAAIASQASVESVEFVGLPPASALDGLPSGLRIELHNTLEAALEQRS